MPAVPALEGGFQGDLEGPRLSRASTRPIAVGWAVSCVAPTRGVVRSSVEIAPTLMAAKGPGEPRPPLSHRPGPAAPLGPDDQGRRLEGDGLNAA